MSFCPSYNLPKTKIKIKSRSTYLKTLNSEAKLQNWKVLSTHSAQIESGFLDSHDEYTLLCMLWMICCTHEKTKSHKSIYECILFFVKNSDQCVIKNLIWFWKIKSIFVNVKKKNWRKKSDLFLNKTKSFGFKKNIRSVFGKLKNWSLIYM